MDLNRREFTVAPAAALAASMLAAAPALPWQRRIRRVGQTNMTEHDPAVLDVEQWADYWASLKVDAVLVSVTGILAFYPTKVPFHRKGKYLGNRDFFGECCAAAKKRGLHVIARMSPDLNWEDAVQAHPEWFERDARGNAVHHTEDPRLFRTCMFTSYMTDYMPAIMREINSLYDVDGLFTNAWPPLGSLPACHCAECVKLPPAGTIEYWDKFNERVVYLWKLYDGIAKEKRPENFFFANLGGGIRSSADLVKLGQMCEWFQCDNQGRGGDDTPIWGCALQGRVCSAVQEGKMSTNVTAAWSTGRPRWRNVYKSPAEERMWFNETLASGMAPYHHIIGGENGMGEDRRWLEPAQKYFNWMARHDPHFINKRSIANIGVVMGQRTHLFYQPPRGALMREYMDGLYYALLEGRFLFDFVHEDKLEPKDLAKYSALLLPNTALLSDRQCSQLRAYVEAGGSLLATFEASLYDERNRRRDDFGLADVFGIRKTGEIAGTTGNAYLARIERQHEILSGFTNTHWIPGAENRVPVAPVEAPVLTVVPGFVAYPPELSYPTEPHTTEPAVVIRQKGKSRLVYFPGDIERTMWRSGHTDLARLLRNAIGWVSGGNAPVAVSGEGVVETFAWETQAGFAVHILNYTNPAMHRGWLREFYAIGPQRVKMSLPAGRKVTRVELLRAESTVPFSQRGTEIEFTVPKVIDYEVAAMHSA
ncbi:MAG TPA: alpha-amylase family protein [Bryobacteraceae bacterium]|nr:alpha-amylase family protein [Bryobacteraceae bacterium]